MYDQTLAPSFIDIKHEYFHRYLYLYLSRNGGTLVPSSIPSSFLPPFHPSFLPPPPTILREPEWGGSAHARIPLSGLQALTHVFHLLPAPAPISLHKLTACPGMCTLLLPIKCSPFPNLLGSVMHGEEAICGLISAVFPRLTPCPRRYLHRPLCCDYDQYLGFPTQNAASNTSDIHLSREMWTSTYQWCPLQAKSMLSWKLAHAGAVDGRLSPLNLPVTFLKRSPAKRPVF